MELFVSLPLDRPADSWSTSALLRRARSSFEAAGTKEGAQAWWMRESIVTRDQGKSKSSTSPCHEPSLCFEANPLALHHEFPGSTFRIPIRRSRGDLRPQSSNGGSDLPRIDPGGGEGTHRLLRRFEPDVARVRSGTIPGSSMEQMGVRKVGREVRLADPSTVRRRCRVPVRR